MLSLSEAPRRVFSTISFEFQEIEWKVRNFFSLPDYLGYVMESPSFDFADANWKLLIYPNGECEDSNGYICLGIKRIYSKIPGHHVLYKCGFKTQREKEFQIFNSQSLFKSGSESWVVANYFKVSKLKEMKKVLAPNGNLTIVFQLRTKKIVENSWRNTSTVACQCQLDEEANSAISIKDYKILNDLRDIYLKKEDCDVIIKVGGKEFPAHRLILTARSPVFASTFRNDMKEKSTGIVDIEDCDPSTFSIFLNFLYSGDTGSLSTENVFSIFKTADKYDVQDLRKQCLDFIKANLSVETFCDTISLALQHFENELIQLSNDFFAKNFREIIVTVKWQQFLIENPTQSNELLIKALVPNKRSK